MSYLTKNSKMCTMRRGIISLGELKVGDMIKTINGFTRVESITPEKEKQEVFKIYTNGGLVLECVEGQKILTVDGWKSIETLNLSDTLKVLKLEKFDTEIDKIQKIVRLREKEIFKIETEDSTLDSNGFLIGM